MMDNELPALAIAAISQNELAHCATLFNTLKQLRIKLKNVDEAALDRAFELHVQVYYKQLRTVHNSYE